MDDIAIKVDNVSKDFHYTSSRAGTLKSLVTSAFKDKNDVEKDIQHALKNISFEIKKGEFFGIVGRNGSGKSTLLKMIAGIYQPNKGKIHVNGRIVPFIELGVGFNPELTGRENVYLNGALLGFSRKEVEAQYQEIVEFAELEKFMDQQLKNYSSGMQVRLAFSMAIRAKADILLIDEVLAVGDEAFQRKCIGYFKNLKDEGKTVVLVTHNMDAVRRFCSRAMLVHDAGIKVIGTPEDVANQYTLENFQKPFVPQKQQDAYEDGLCERVPKFRIIPVSKPLLTSADELVFEVEYKITDDTPVNVHISIIDEIRNVSIVNNGAKSKSGKGTHRLRYLLPLRLYNNCDLYVHAVLDEEKTRKRIAFTNEKNSHRFAIRNATGNNGLISATSGEQGYWHNWDSFTYNKNEDNT